MAWNKPTSDTVDATSSSRSSGRGKMPRLRPILAGAAVVVALGVLCLWMFSGGETRQDAASTKDRGHIKEVNRPHAVKANARGSAASDSAGASLASFSSSSTSNSLDSLSAVNAEARNSTNTVATPVFTDPSDFLISQTVAMDLSGRKPLPPSPPMSEAALERMFETSLKQEIKILPTDSEKVKKMKEAVIAAREEIIQMRKDGRTVKEILETHEKMCRENAETRANVMRELREIRKTHGDEEARHYMTVMNLALQQMGIAEVEWPKTLQQRRAEREAREDAEIGL